jgi:hypothetical protein
MSDFLAIQKRLDYGPVQQDTDQNVKPLSFAGVRDIKKQRQLIEIPANRFNHAALGQLWNIPKILYQLNYTISQAFRLTNFEGLSAAISISLENVGQNFLPLAPGCCFCLRYRYGNNVTRIFLGGSRKEVAGMGGIISYRLYRNFIYMVPFSNQAIPKNFVIEFWYVPTNNSIVFSNPFCLGLFNPIYMATSITHNPQDSNDNSPTILNSVMQVNIASLITALPETLPTVINGNGPWLSN